MSKETTTLISHYRCLKCGERIYSETSKIPRSQGYFGTITQHKFASTHCKACRWETSPARGGLLICDDPELVGALTCPGEPD